jgi:capsular polysaccharide biosynthesis protein
MAGPPPVATVGRALRRRHWLIWGLALLAGILAVGAAMVRPPTYEASALLSVDETPSATQGFDSAVQADQFLTQRFIAMATSAPVLQAVCAKEGRGCDATALAKRVRATTTRTTAQLSILVDDPSPQAAARLANEVAQQVVDRNAAQAEAQVAGQRAFLQGQLKQLGDQMAQATQQAQVSAAGGRSDAAPLSQLSLLQAQYGTTYQRLQDLDVQRAQLAGVISIVQPATPPARPADPDPVRYALVGVAGGLVAGLLLALLAERLRTRVHQGSELGEAARCSVVVDLSRGGRARAAGPYRFLARLVRSHEQGGPRALMVVASGARDHVNEVGLGLAHAIAEGGERSLVVLAPSPDGGEPEQREVDVGGPPPLEAAGAPGRQLRPRAEYDLTIHCSLPPMLDPGLSWLEPATDRALVVATRGAARFADVRRTADLLRQVDVDVVAAVLLPARMRPEPSRGRQRVDGSRVKTAALER